MNRDLKLIIKYKGPSSYGTPRADQTFGKLLEQARYDTQFKDIDLVDLDMLKGQIDEMMEYLFHEKRFRQINSLFGGKIKIDYTEQYFMIDDHKFYSLEELEKAWKNKAFL